MPKNLVKLLIYCVTRANDAVPTCKGRRRKYKRSGRRLSQFQLQIFRSRNSWWVPCTVAVATIAIFTNTADPQAMEGARGLWWSPRAQNFDSSLFFLLSGGSHDYLVMANTMTGVTEVATTSAFLPFLSDSHRFRPISSCNNFHL